MESLSEYREVFAIVRARMATLIEVRDGAFFTNLCGELMSDSCRACNAISTWSEVLKRRLHRLVATEEAAVRVGVGLGTAATMTRTMMRMMTIVVVDVVVEGEALDLVEGAAPRVQPERHRLVAVEMEDLPQTDALRLTVWMMTMTTTTKVPPPSDRESRTTTTLSTGLHASAEKLPSNAKCRKRARTNTDSSGLVKSPKVKIAASLSGATGRPGPAAITINLAIMELRRDAMVGAMMMEKLRGNVHAAKMRFRGRWGKRVRTRVDSSGNVQSLRTMVSAAFSNGETSRRGMPALLGTIPLEINEAITMAADASRRDAVAGWRQLQRPRKRCVAEGVRH